MPHLLAFTDYAGPVTNLTYNDPSMMKAIRTLGVGSLRYPGGNTANHWNLTSGRWTGLKVDDDMPDWQAVLIKRNAAVPEGTFTPKRHMQGIGSLLHAPPTWNLNVVSLPENEMVGQIDVLKSMGVPVERIELGNEGANAEHYGFNCDEYFRRCALVSGRAREVFPDAQIGIIGSWRNPEEGIPAWEWCDKRIKEHLDMFDAVTVHTYTPGTTTLLKYPSEQRPVVTLAAAEVLVSYHVAEAAKYAGGKPIWLNELNWGGSWMGDVTWPALKHGTLRGLHFASYFLSVLGHKDNTFAALQWYSLFYQEGASWSYWASIAYIPLEANMPEKVKVDAVAQVFAHLSFVALRQGYTQVQPVLDVAAEKIPSDIEVFGTKDLPCVQAVLFSGHDDRCTFILLNRCSTEVEATFTSPLPGLQEAKESLYSGDTKNVGGWTRVDDIDISSLESPPWVGGPVAVENKKWSSTTNAIKVSLSPITLHFVELMVDDEPAPTEASTYVV